jgi:hypothetical protein
MEGGEMNNYAGMNDKDEEIAKELEIAGIEVTRMSEVWRNHHPEMRTIIIGELGPWTFQRAWYYWVATGPGIPPQYADKLHEKFGTQVRVDGHCMCPSPLEWFKGFAVGHYHVDTQEGLNALAETIRSVVKESEKRKEKKNG